jgi:hypothetical protein
MVSPNDPKFFLSIRFINSIYGSISLMNFARSPCAGPDPRTLNLNIQNRLIAKNRTVDEARAEIHTFEFDLEWQTSTCRGRFSIKYSKVA